MMKILVVGGGVAGICLTHELLKQGCAVRLLDNNRNASSAVAAGLINPLVFRRMTLSWRVAELLPYAYRTYREMEELTGVSFLHPLVIRRLFASQQELEFWMKKQLLPEFEPYMELITDADMDFQLAQNTFGTGRVKQASYIDTAPFLEGNRAYFQTAGILQEETFEIESLDPQTAVYKGEAYDYILFAEGKDGKYNPFFSYLPLQQTKGELLTIQSDRIYAEESLNRKCFLLPLGNGRFKVGSTYVWDTDNTDPTEEGAQTIAENLRSITTETYEIVEHRAGVRPTVPDRRPLFGKHPEFSQLVFANGLGTKGYMLAPLMAHELINHLLHGTPLNPECDLTRFQKN